MSYEFDLCFKQCKDITEAFAIARNMVNDLKSKTYLQKFLDLNIRYAPFSDKIDETKGEYIPTQMDRYWLYSLFNVKFLWWEEEKLLALCGYLGYPKNLIKKYFDVHVFFQNGSDHNYSIRSWGKKINVFNECIEKWKNATKKEILGEECKRKYFDDGSSYYNYYKLTFIYDDIFERLDLGTYESSSLLGTQSKVFETFAINGITHGWSDTYALTCHLRLSIKSSYEETKLLLERYKSKS